MNQVCTSPGKREVILGLFAVMFIFAVAPGRGAIAQEISAGVGLDVLPSFSVVSAAGESPYSNLVLYCVSGNCRFASPIQWTTGVLFHYGRRNLLEFTPGANPGAPSGAGSQFGIDRSMQFFSFEVPVMIRLGGAGPMTCDGGIKLGMATMTQTDTWSAYEMQSGALLSASEYTTSKTSAIFAPTVNLGLVVGGPFSVSISADYVIFQPTLVHEAAPTTSADPKQGSNPLFGSLQTRSEWEYRMSGLRIGGSVWYSF